MFKFIRKITGKIKNLFSPIKRKTVKRELAVYKKLASDLNRRVKKFEKKALSLNPSYASKIEDIKQFSEQQKPRRLNIRLSSLATAGFNAAQLSSFVKRQNMLMEKNINKMKNLDYRLRKASGEFDKLLTTTPEKAERIVIDEILNEGIKKQIATGDETADLFHEPYFREMRHPIFDYEVDSEMLYQYYYHGSDALFNYLNTFNFNQPLDDVQVYNYIREKIDPELKYYDQILRNDNLESI